MWIMVAGPYATGAKTASDRAANLRVLNEAAMVLLRAGHVPIIGVNLALPVIEAAGNSDAAYAEVMMPLSLAVAERCDGCLRVGGASHGADEEMARFVAAGRPVWRRVEDVPGVAAAPS